MTQIKIEVPANDHIALSAMADALQRIAAERAPSVTAGDSQVEQCDTLIKQCEEFKTPKGDDFVEPVDVEIARMDEETKGFSVPDNYEESIANFHTSPRSADEPETEQDDTLDADGLPWDKRIHSRGKTRLSDDTWRLARKPNDKTDEEWSAYVESVKSELKAVQDIPSVEPVEDQTPNDNEQYAKAWKEHYGDDDPLDEQAVADLTPPVTLTDEQVREEIKEKLESGEVTVEAPLTPPVIDTDTPNGMSEANETPVAPVTPPTSLTPPVVEAPVTEPSVEAPSDQPSVTTFQELMLYITGNAKKRGADNDMIKATLAEVDPALTAIPLIATRADLIPKFVTALEAKLS